MKRKLERQVIISDTHHVFLPNNTNSIQVQEALGNQYFYDVSADVMSGNTRGNKRRHNNQGRPPRPPPKPMGNSIFVVVIFLFSFLILI